jgi:hypothetical protein
VYVYGWSALQFILLPELPEWAFLYNTMDVAILFPTLHIFTAVPGEKVISSSFVV